MCGATSALFPLRLLSPTKRTHEYWRRGANKSVRACKGSDEYIQTSVPTRTAEAQKKKYTNTHEKSSRCTKNDTFQGLLLKRSIANLVVI